MLLWILWINVWRRFKKKIALYFHCFAIISPYGSRWYWVDPGILENEGLVSSSAINFGFQGEIKCIDHFLKQTCDQHGEWRKGRCNPPNPPTW
jgi:hypothetical protein